MGYNKRLSPEQPLGLQSKFKQEARSYFSSEKLMEISQDEN